MSEAIVAVGSWQEAETFAQFNVSVSEWLGGSGGQVVVDAAVEAVVGGLESHGLACLAGATRRDADAEANEWVPKIATEFGLSLPDRMSTTGLLRAARVDALRFIAGGSVDPRGLVARLWQRFVDSGYAAELDVANRLDTRYELIAFGDLPEADRAGADAEARVIARDLVASQLVGAPLPCEEFWIGDCGQVARAWNVTARDLAERTHVPAAQAHARLISAIDSRWNRRAVLKTSMHDLLFIRPGDEPYVDQALRVSWSEGVFAFSLQRRGQVVAGDKCFEDTAPAVLAAFLCQLVGGEP